MKKEAIAKLVRAWKQANKLDETYVNLGFGENPYADIAGHIADAIYCMLGEKTMTYDESVTATLLENNSLSVDECAGLLFTEYENHRESPSLPELSPHINGFLSRSAKKRGVSTTAMIRTILGEWVLRHEWLNSFAK